MGTRSHASAKCGRRGWLDAYTLARVNGLVRAISIRPRMACDMTRRRRGESIDSTVTVVLRSHRRSRRTLRLRGNTWHTLRPSGPCRQALARALRQIGTTGKLPLHWDPNQWLNSGRLVPTRGAVARRHERGMGCGGRESVGVQVRSQGELNLVSGLQARKTNDVLAYGKTVWS
jgi:hypothetical protein